jgi:hypothetical protein
VLAPKALWEHASHSRQTASAELSEAARLRSTISSVACEPSTPRVSEGDIVMETISNHFLSTPTRPACRGSRRRLVLQPPSIRPGHGTLVD